MMAVSIDVAFAGAVDGVSIVLFEMAYLLTVCKPRSLCLEETGTG
jgi:energy-converting hydrogenase Eha subunit C